MRRRQWLNHLAVIGLVVCLEGCATAPRQAGVDDSSRFELDREAAQRADAVAHYGAGMIYHSQSSFDEALAEFEKAVELDPSNEDLAADVAREYLRRKQNSKAIALLEKSIVKNSDSTQLLYLLGYAYKAENQPDKALAAFQAIVRLSPAEITAYREVVVIYLTQNKRKETLKLLNEAYKQKSDDDKYWALLGDMFALTVYDESMVEKPASSKETNGPPVAVTAKRKSKGSSSS